MTEFSNYTQHNVICCTLSETVSESSENVQVGNSSVPLIILNIVNEIIQKLCRFMI